MKIRNMMENQAIEKKVEVPGGRGSVKGGAFGTILEEELKLGSAAPMQAGETGAMVDPLATMGPLSWNMGSPGGENEVMGQIESTLSSLEALGAGLQDRTVGPGAIDGAIEKLMSDVDDLRGKLEAFPEEHPLKQLGNELGVLAYVESVKWRRGDYL